MTPQKERTIERFADHYVEAKAASRELCDAIGDPCLREKVETALEAIMKLRLATFTPRELTELYKLMKSRQSNEGGVQ